MTLKNSEIAVLVSARRNSKFLAKFLFGFFERTADPADTPVFVMLNEHDTWNVELEHFFSHQGMGVVFDRENMRLGRAGLHEYFNSLLRQTNNPDWVIYFCEDHFIVKTYWDDYVRSTIALMDLNPDDVWCLIPKFDNCGAMNQILSRGYIKALGGVVGRHGWIDSYINDLNAAIPDRVVRFDDEMFHDFTHDQPNPMADSEVQSLSTDKGKLLPPYDSDTTRRYLVEDQDKLINAIKKEGRHADQS